MKKRIWFLALSLLAVLALTGCGNRTIKEMYALPKRSKEYAKLQSAIDSAMYGLTYSSPRSGANQQTVQMADLDGDGTNEYLVFAKSAKEEPLQVLVFKQEADGSVRNMEIISSSGLEFEQVEYVEFDDKPGLELVIGQQVGDQVPRSVSVYSFAKGEAELLLLSGYSRFITCDMDKDKKSELMVLRPGEDAQRKGVALLYSCGSGQVARSVETSLSADPSDIQRIVAGKLENGRPAVYVASTTQDNSIVTDVFTIQDKTFSNIALPNEEEKNGSALRNPYQYPDDIDSDGILEIPAMVNMKPVGDGVDAEQVNLLRWFSLNSDGWQTDKLFTFHNYVEGWYIRLSSTGAGRVSVEQLHGEYKFYVWDEVYRVPTHLFSVFTFTSATRDEDAVKQGRFALYRAEGIAYAGRLEEAAREYGITEESLIHSFRLIRQDWTTGES